jgi:hypothetical protein
MTVLSDDMAKRIPGSARATFCRTSALHVAGVSNSRWPRSGCALISPVPSAGGDPRSGHRGELRRVSGLAPGRAQRRSHRS